MVVVSGGGWGVGDIEGAVRQLVAADEVSSIVCLSGRNEQLQARLLESFGDERRVFVYGFTHRMPEILAAADVLVHSTGGVTCLEARATGTPVVSYGLPVGHARLNTKAMADLDLLRMANDTAELRAHVRASFSGEAAPPSAEEAMRPAAADIVLQATPRVRPLPPWLLNTRRLAAQFALLLAVGTWMMSTDEVAALANKIFGVHPLAQVQTTRPDVALVVRTPADRVVATAQRLAADGLHITLADGAGSSTPPRSRIYAVRAAGDGLVPEEPHSSFLHWLSTRSQLHRQASALRLGRHYYYLPPRGGADLGQLVLAKIAGDTPVDGAIHMKADEPLRGTPQAGDVVVVESTGSNESVADVARVGAWIRSRGLKVEPLTALTSQAVQ